MSAGLLPLAGVRVIERANGAAAAYAGRMLAMLGAETIMLEPEAGGALRREPPFLPGGTSATFAYLAAGKRSVVYDPASAIQRDNLIRLLRASAIYIEDTPLAARAAEGFDPRRANPDMIHVSVLPFGATGPKASWKGEEINLVHAGGEGNLLPNGLTLELFPDRAPLKMYGNFVQYQAGVTAAMAALAALLSAAASGGQFVDISIQDVAVSLSVMAIQRFGDGVLEHRGTRSFRYGGVFACADGYVELITAEDHQWTALLELLGNPAWARDPALADALERGRRGAEINVEIRRWTQDKCAADLVARGQELGVPIAKYRTSADVLGGDHERSRGLFSAVPIDGAGELPVLVAPMQLDSQPLFLGAGPPRLGADQRLLADAATAPREMSI